MYVLFVDDGSTDETLEILEAVCNRDQRFACLSLSRNFGQEHKLAFFDSHLTEETRFVRPFQGR